MLVRSTRDQPRDQPPSLDVVDGRAVTNKMKGKAFARQVPRDRLLKGADEIGVRFDDHVTNVVAELKPG